MAQTRIAKNDLKWINGEVKRRNRRPGPRHNQETVIADLVGRYQATQCPECDTAVPTRKCSCKAPESM